MPGLPTLPPPGNLLSRDSGGGCGRHQPRSGRLCLEGDDAAATDAVLTAQEGAAARDRAQGGGAALHREETAPGQSFEQTKPGTSGASDRGNRDITKRQGARVPGPLQVSHTPQSPAQTPCGQQKILFALPPSLRNQFSHPKPKPGAKRKQRPSTQHLSALEDRTPSPAFAPGQGTSANPTLMGHLCSLLAPK